nr:MAG TPA: hypothetical protein [Crassvirales sp.]
MYSFDNLIISLLIMEHRGLEPLSYQSLIKELHILTTF